VTDDLQSSEKGREFVAPGISNYGVSRLRFGACEKRPVDAF
jgi:hypothetical protein